jgi:hypothetical protein
MKTATEINQIQIHDYLKTRGILQDTFVVIPCTILHLGKKERHPSK